MDPKKRRGFAGMDEAKQREIASKGGKAAHEKGTAHRFTREEAQAAGRKGGQVAHIRGTAHEFTPEEARAAGRKGGKMVRGRRIITGPSVGGQIAYEPGGSESSTALVTAPASAGIREEAGVLLENRDRFADRLSPLPEND